MKYPIITALNKAARHRGMLVVAGLALTLGGCNTAREAPIADTHAQ